MQLIKWYDEKGRKYTDDEMYLCLSDLKLGAVFISGPTMSGKTSMLKRIQADNESEMSIITDEYLVNYIFRSCINGSVKEKDFSEKTGRKILAIEDIDFLRDKEATQKEAGNILNELLREEKVIIITGIELKKRVPYLIDTMRKNTAKFFEFSNDSEGEYL